MSSVWCRCVFVAVAVCCATITPLLAEPDAQAFAAYVEGDYEGAASIAAGIGDAENLAFAARSLNAAAYFLLERKTARDLADRAFDYGEQAIEADALLVEAHLQSAIALALRASNMAPFRVFFKNIPSRARSRIDVALELDPEDYWALATSAAWHMEVARAGVGVIYGADRALGYQQFLDARRLAPDNLNIAYECALRLLASEKEEWRATALEALDAALFLEATTAFEAEVAARAIGLKEAVVNGVEAEAAFIAAQP